MVLSAALDEALSHSLIFDEHKGDFVQARVAAEEGLAAAQADTNPTVIADALLGRGVVHMLQGEGRLALQAFEQIDGLVPADLTRRIRGLAYRRLAVASLYDALTDTLAAGDPANDCGVLEFTELQKLGAARKQLGPAAEAVQAADSSLRLEIMLVSRVLVDQHLLGANRGILSRLPGELREQLATTTGLTEIRDLARAVGVPLVLAYADRVEAEIEWQVGKTDSALSLLQRAMNGYQGAGDEVGLGACYLLRGDWLSAPFSTPLAWNRAITRGMLDNSLSESIEAAEADLSEVDFVAASKAYNQAAELFDSARAARGKAAVSLRRAYLSVLQDDYVSAQQAAEQARAEFETVGDLQQAKLALAHHMLAGIGLGQFPADISAASDIGNWGATTGSLSLAAGIGLLFGRLGRYWFTRRGDCERSLACFELAATVFHAVNSAGDLARSTVDKALVYQTIGEDAAAWESFIPALEMFSSAASGADGELGALWLEAGQLTQQLAVYSIGLGDSSQLQPAVSRLEALSAQGKAAATSGKAGMFLPQEVDVFVAGATETLASASVVVPLSAAKAAADPNESARQYALALEAATAAPVPDREFLTGAVLAEQGRYSEASAAYKRYLALDAQVGRGSFIETLLRKLGGALAQAQGLAVEQQGHVRAMGLFASVLDFATAKTHLDWLNANAPESWWNATDQPWETLRVCGQVLEALADFGQALTWYERGVADLEARRGKLASDELKSALADQEGAQRLYFAAARTCVRLHEQGMQDHFAERGFNLIDRGKARALLDLMLSTVWLGRSSPDGVSAVGEWRRLTAQLTLWRSQLQRAQSDSSPDARLISRVQAQIETDEANLRSVETKLASIAPDFHQTINPQQTTLSVADVAAALPPDTLLLQYAYLEDDFLVWAVTDRGLAQVSHSVVDAVELDRHISQYIAACNDVQLTQQLPTLGSAIADVLIGPVAEMIAAHPRLLIVPYGAAHSLPVHALPLGEERLGADRSITYLTSASSLVRSMSKEPTYGRQVLAIGNPTSMAYVPPLGLPSSDQRPLIYAEFEARYVGSLHQDAIVAVGDEATRDAVINWITAEHPRLIHLATHAYVHPGWAGRSAILFAHGTCLMAYELIGLQLGCQLAVLAACDSATGDLGAGEDLYGLVRSALAAGARSVVGGLWEVNDVSTLLFMSRFHQELTKGADADSALSTAATYIMHLNHGAALEAISMLQSALPQSAVQGVALDTSQIPEDYSSPRYWAPYILVR
jgi:CHAT domain-containing protein/tetratricopeptide (TPR) repeat protein